jgi:hypothetical protein
MRTVSKKTIDKLIQAEKDYSASYCTFDREQSVSVELQEQTDIGWLCWIDLISSLLTKHGFMPNATNGDIYKVLEALGVEVVDD